MLIIKKKKKRGVRKRRETLMQVVLHVGGIDPAERGVYCANPGERAGVNNTNVRALPLRDGFSSPSVCVCGCG